MKALFMAVTQRTYTLAAKKNSDAMQAPREQDGRAWVLYSIAIVSYVIARLIVWQQTTLLEDHDSVSYLESIKVFLTWDTDRILKLSPDTTPLFPFLGALCGLPGWSVETGARLCALLSSLVLVFALIGIGRRFTSPAAITFGLFILALNPAMIPLSISVLTEPVFIALIHLGLYLFWRQYQNPTAGKGLLLGLVFGLSFLARTEGMIFLAAVPFFQLIHFKFFRRAEYYFKHLLVWAFCFMIGFAAVSSPQIWRVSQQMGRFAINGRQAWELILYKADGKSYDEKIYGLDYSPSQTNLQYIQSHPEALSDFASSFSAPRLAKIMMRNLSELYQKHAGILLGPLGLMLFAFGILSLIDKGRYYEMFLIFVFVGAVLVAPLIHDGGIDVRHVAIVGPLMMLIEGLGIVYISRFVLSSNRSGDSSFLLTKGLSLGLMGLLVFFNAYPLLQTFRPPQSNFEYSPEAFTEPLAIVKKETQPDLKRAPRIAVRKGYFTYMANADRFFVPFTDYDGLVKYCRLNDIDYLFLQDNLVQKYPFFEHFKVDPSEFLRLYKGVDDFGNIMRLYRFNRAAFSAEERVTQEDFSQ